MMRKRGLLEELVPGGAGLKRPRTDEVPTRIFVGGLAYATNWQRLKDHFSQAGEVQFARIKEDKGKGKGRPWSLGSGMVEFATEEEAQNAIVTLDGSELDGRQLKLDAWTTGWTKDMAGE
mmetsp:Transcript_20164/g.47209  ORF Transcript_20164/g.47209 Transcript_20164/m.47209 type:complete len:120 (-) Transcript_20164:267-626(-)